MQKVYLVFVEHYDHGSTFTDVVHVCQDADLAVKYANNYISDTTKDAKEENLWFGRKSFTKKELFGGFWCCYLATVEYDINKDIEIVDRIGETYSIKIKEYEVRED